MASEYRAGRAQGTGTHSLLSFQPRPPDRQLFNDAIRLAVSYKQNSRDFMDEVLQELEVRHAQMSGEIEKTASLRGLWNITHCGGSCLPLQAVHAHCATPAGTRFTGR